MADRPQRVAVIDFRAPNAFDIPVSVFTMAVPLSTPKGEFSPRATSQELLNLLVKLQTYIPKHHARLAAWKDIFRSELADMPLTEIEIKRFFEN